MDKQKVYQNHWMSEELAQWFSGFKKFIFPAEEKIVTQSVQQINDKISKESVNILELGPGDGRLTRVFLCAASSYWTVEKYVGVELSKTLTEKMKEQISDFGQFAKEVTLVNEAAETYEPMSNFDLICSLNSWYGIELGEIETYKDFLNESGLLAILLSKRGSVVVDLTEQFIEPMLSAEDVQEYLDRNSLSYRIVDLKSAKISKKDYVEHPSANDLFMYLTRGKIDEDKIRRYLLTKPEEYFHLPQSLFLISG